MSGPETATEVTMGSRQAGPSNRAIAVLEAWGLLRGRTV